MIRTEELPRFVEPMLASAGALPRTDDLVAEVKWDGIRAQLRWDGQALTLRSRPGRDCTAEFPELEAVLEDLDRRPLILDGELVCFGPGGHPDFTALRGRLRTTPRNGSHAFRPATFVAFDVLHYDGRSTRSLPYRERRALLESVAPTPPLIRVTPAFADAIEEALHVTRETGLEGVVIKNASSPYRPGRRSRAWVKRKHRRRETMIVTGWRMSQNEPDSFLLARKSPDGRLVPAGAASLGLIHGERVALRKELASRALKQRRGTTWVTPDVEVTVDAHGRPGKPVRDAVLRSWQVRA